MSKLEHESGSNPDAAQQKALMIRLWSDRPQYVDLLRDQVEIIRMPRLVTSTPPKYPLVPLLANVKSTVVVSFVVDGAGKVEAARVLESSDSRFEQAALDAVMQWRFLPAESTGGPSKVMLAIPIVFDGKK